MMSETPSQLMIAAEVALWLRMRCSTIYGWAATGKIPSVKMNGAIRFVRSDIEYWINDRSRMPADSPIRPILPSKPTSVSRVTIQRAGARAIRHVADRQQLQRNLRCETPFPTNNAEKRKGRA
jgi:predicted DNA-binding transcriptional regulator AlpA